MSGHAATETTGKPPAVVMDLDETVIDNSGSQTVLYLTESKHTSANWEAWVNYQATASGAARAVPGAADFITKVEEAGIMVVFITNRDESLRQRSNVF